MEIKKGYQQTEIGVIPVDWEVKRLGDIALLIVSGKSDTTKNIGIYPIFGSTGIIGFNNKYDYEGEKILVARVGANAGTVNCVNDKYCVSDNTLVIELKKDYVFTFVVFFMNYFNLNKLVFGSGQPLITGSQLKHLSIPLPPTKAEQTTIATVLSDTDALIEKIKKIIAKKRNIKQGAMQELLTGKKRLPGFEQKKGYKQTELGEIPVDWEVKKLGDVSDNNIRWSFTGGPFGSNLKSSDYTKEGIRIIQLQNIGDGVFVNNYEIYTSEAKANELLSCNIYPGEIILSKMGDPVARACIIPEFQHRYVMCSDGIRLVVDKKRHNTYFIFELINSPQFRKLAENASTGSTRKRIGLTELRNLNIICPKLEEQTAIANILSDVDEEIVALEKKLEKYKKIKQGMMQELLTGKTRLL